MYAFGALDKTFSTTRQWPLDPVACDNYADREKVIKLGKAFGLDAQSAGRLEHSIDIEKANLVTFGRWKTPLIFFLLQTVFWILYAMTRYIIIGGEPWTSLSTYILNKGVCAAAMTAVAKCALDTAVGESRERITGKTANPVDNPRLVSALNSRKQLSMLGVGFAAMHGFLSSLIMDPNYFALYFESDGDPKRQKLNFKGGTVLFLGVIGLALYLIIALANEKVMGQRERKFVYSVLGWSALLVCEGHVVANGLKGWLNPAGWAFYGYLPPITLLVSILPIMALTIKATNVTYMTGRYCRARFFSGSGKNRVGATVTELPSTDGNSHEESTVRQRLPARNQESADFGAGVSGDVELMESDDRVGAFVPK